MGKASVLEISGFLPFQLDIAKVVPALEGVEVRDGDGSWQLFLMLRAATWSDGSTGTGMEEISMVVSRIEEWSAGVEYAVLETETCSTQLDFW